MSKDTLKVLVFGLGSCVIRHLLLARNECEGLIACYSIGGFYAFILGRAKNLELSVVARSNFDVVKTQVCDRVPCRHRRH
jgi:hypothetical protein